MNTSSYNEAEALTSYVIRNYGHLMTPFEYQARRHMLVEAKNNAYGSCEKAIQIYQRIHGRLAKEARALLEDGPTLFHARVRDRILSEHAHEIILNRCEKCGSLCRTPKACLCPVCNHTWYDRRRQ